MSLANQAVFYNLGLQGWTFQDNETAGGAAGVTTQGGATAILGEGIRLLRGAANFSCVQKSVLTGDAAPIVFVINDGPNAYNIFPAPGEFNNGVVNQVLSCPAGQSQIWIRVPNNLSGGSSGWRSSNIP